MINKKIKIIILFIPLPIVYFECILNSTFQKRASSCRDKEGSTTKLAGRE